MTPLRAIDHWRSDWSTLESEDGAAADAAWQRLVAVSRRLGDAASAVDRGLAGDRRALAAGLARMAKAYAALSRG